jgi:hypothetical protein
MGQLVHFYAGDPLIIGRAFEAHDFRTLDDRSVIPLFSDFSLHLSPIDYDLLSEAIHSSVGKGPTTLTDSLEREVGGTPNEGSAETVSDAWVEMIAAVDEDRLDAILRVWAAAVAEEHRESVMEPNDDMRMALRDLIALCRESRARGLTVVHTWSL